MHLDKQIYELIFPPGTFEYFTITEGHRDGDAVSITLEEKDVPPLTPEHADKKIVAKKFHDITVTDFPLRGKKTELTFRRRYWKIEGSEGYLKRDVHLTFPGTKLEKEFGDFLKDEGGRNPDVPRLDRNRLLSRAERI